MKLEMRLKKLFVTALISLVFVCLTASNIVYAAISPTNTRLGHYAGYKLTSYSLFNTLIGASSGYNNTGHYNTFLGWYSGYWNTTGQGNTFLGFASGYKNATGIENTFIGFRSGLYNITGKRNTFLGSYSGNRNTRGSGNTFLGYYSGLSNTTGFSNTFLGLRSGYKNTTGNSNTFMGSFSGQLSTTGQGNTFIGFASGHFNDDGTENTFVGLRSGYKNADGKKNVFIGYMAGYKCNEGTFYRRNSESEFYGNENTYIGYKAGYSNIEGTGNVFIGHQAGYNETGSHKLHIAANSDSTLIYGDFARGYVGINTTDPSYELDLIDGTIRGIIVSPSDVRLKEDIHTIEGALEKVSELRGVRFKWIDKSRRNNPEIGLIAQEVEKIIPEVVSEDDGGIKSVAYDKIVGVLIEATKELKAEKDAEIAALKAKLDTLENMFLAISTTPTTEKLVAHNQAELHDVQKTIQ